MYFLRYVFYCLVYMYLASSKGQSIELMEYSLWTLLPKSIKPMLSKSFVLGCNGTKTFFVLCSIVYGALLTKTNRISRIFNASKQSAQRPNFISPKSQLCICSGIVLIQVLINVIWFLISPPEAMHHHPTREDNLLVCKVSISNHHKAVLRRLWWSKHGNFSQTFPRIHMLREFFIDYLSYLEKIFPLRNLFCQNLLFVQKLDF